jgi:hypothetical protein
LGPADFCYQKFAKTASSAKLTTMISLMIGTNRPDSNSRKVAAQIEEIYADLKVPLRMLDLGNCRWKFFHRLPTPENRNHSSRSPTRFCNPTGCTSSRRNTMAASPAC